MASFDLPRLARAQGFRRRAITLRPIQPTQAAATDLAAIMAPAWRIWSEGLERILAEYDPPPLDVGDALTLDSPSLLQRIIEAIAGEFATRLVVDVTPRLRDFAVRAERVHRRKWSAAVAAGTGVQLETVLTAQPVAETLEVWLARNAALVRNVSEQAQGRIADAVFRGYQNRTSAREIARELREAVGLGRKRAIRIAADQSSKLSSALDQERMAEAGVRLWRYRHSGKAHPRSWHKARDGRIYQLGTDKQVKPDGSPMPGGDRIDSGDGPGEPPWCACRRQAYLAIQAELERA